VSAGERRLSRQVKHLILLEDDRDVAAMLTRLLGEEGYYVTCATRTADACEVLERVKVDLLIADVLLPDGTCFAAVDIAKRKGVPYILMTGSPDQMAQLRTNGDFHLSKPFKLIAFMDEVRCRIGPGEGEGRN
jgi:DNA-binding response OmpR family regulator